jgi:pilus assembly protein Flp/PilA
MRTVLQTLHCRISTWTWLSREEGQGLTEYALVLALIGLVAVVSLSLLGGKVTTILSTVGRST